MTHHDQTPWRVTAFGSAHACSGVALRGTSATTIAARLAAADTALAALIELDGTVCLSVTVGDQFAITLVDTDAASPEERADIVADMIVEQISAGGLS